MKIKLLTLCLLSVNVIAASSEGQEGSGGAAGGAGRVAVRPESLKEEVKRSVDALDAVVERKGEPFTAEVWAPGVGFTYFLKRPLSANSRIPTNSKDRRYNFAEQYAYDGMRAVSLEYFKHAKYAQFYLQDIADLERENAALKAELEALKRK